MYSLSTSWNSYRHTDGRAMLREIRDLGFEYAELSHGIRISLLPGVLEAVDAGEIKISSLHNFCPLPLGINQAAPNIFEFSSSDQRERERAFKYTLKTMETALRVKANTIVLHSGSVRMPDFTDQLVEMVAEDERDEPKYDQVARKALQRRERSAKKYVENTVAMLERIAEEADKRDLRLGIENREALEEIPFETDFVDFLARFPAAVVGYWHDTGHAQIKEELGFARHRLLLESMHDRLFGFHVHDVKFPCRDHCVPGEGMIDFAALKPMVKPEHIKVFELKPAVSPEEVKQGVAHIKKLWGDA